MSTFQTSFGIYLKEGTWKNCSLYEGRFSYASGYEYRKMTDLTDAGTALSTTYQSLTINEQDILNLGGGYMSNTYVRVNYVGKGQSKTQDYAYGTSGPNDRVFFPILGGCGYAYLDNGKLKFVNMMGDSKNGAISQRIMGEFTPPTANALPVAMQGFYSGIIVPLKGSSSNTSYYCYYPQTGEFKQVSAVTGLTLDAGAVLVLDNMDSYFFLRKTGAKYMHTFVNGVEHFYDLSALDATDYDSSQLCYDAVNECILLYLGKRTDNNSTLTQVTKCYKLDMDGKTKIEEVTLPNSVVLPTTSDSDDSYGCILLNGSSSNRVYQHSRYMYLDSNGYQIAQNPVVRFNYANFGANGKQTPQQYLMMQAWYGYDYYSQPIRIAYFDNLYFDNSGDAKIFKRATT